MCRNVLTMTRRPPLPFNGAKLLALRVRQGLTQHDLSAKAAEAGRRIERATISRYETGEATPSAANFDAILRVLDCEPDDLLDSDAA